MRGRVPPIRPVERSNCQSNNMSACVDGQRTGARAQTAYLRLLLKILLMRHKTKWLMSADRNTSDPPPMTYLHRRFDDGRPPPSDLTVLSLHEARRHLPYEHPRTRHLRERHLQAQTPQVCLTRPVGGHVLRRLEAQGPELGVKDHVHEEQLNGLCRTGPWVMGYRATPKN